MAKAKKDFMQTEAAQKVKKDDPVMDFITTDEPEETPAPAERPPEGFKVDYRYVEAKKRRLQLVMQPSLFERIKAEADRQRLSVNEYCHRILDENTPKVR